MDFDFRHIAVPFRMRPGLLRLDPGASHLTPLNRASALYREKLAVSQAGAALHCVAGFDPAPALRAIHRQLQATGARSMPEEAGSALELAFEEDLALLDAGTATVLWMCVCVPSRWAPEDKLGKSLAAIHAPVADNADLVAALPRLTRLLGNGGHWERFAWTITPSARYDQHPLRHPVPAWPMRTDPAEFAANCYFRAERQTFLPVHDGHDRPIAQTMFTIRVMVEPLTSVVRDAKQAQRLHDALRSMTPAVLAYKNLATARAPLLAWLSAKAAG